MTTKPPYAPSTASFPSNVHDECRALNSQAGHLHHLAHAFIATGNSHAADKLFDIADTIIRAERAIREHVFRRVDSDLKAAQDMSATVLRSVLAGAHLVADDKEAS